MNTRPTDSPGATDRRGGAAAPLARRLLDPGLALMGRLRLHAKLALLLAVLALPTGLLLLQNVGDLTGARQQVLAGRTATQAMQATLPLVEALMRLRGLTARVLAGDGEAGAPRDDARRQVAQHLAALEAALGAHGSPPDGWSATRRAIADLAAGRHPADAAAAFAAHSEAVDRVRHLVQQLADSVTRAGAGDPTTAMLAELLVNTVLPMMDATGIVRGRGAAALQQPESATPAVRLAILGPSAWTRQQTAHVATRLGWLERAGVPAAGAWPASRRALEQFHDQAQQLFIEHVPAGDARAFFDQGSVAIVHLAALGRDTLVRLDERLAARQTALDRALATLLAAAAAGVAVALYLAIACFAGIRSSLAAVLHSTLAVARGDLSARVAVRTHDELADIGHAVDAMNERLSAMVAQIRSHASRVDEAGAQMADGSQRLAGRTEQQAHSLATSVEAVGQLTAAVEGNAEAARSLDELTQRLFAQAEDGHAAMAETLQAMQDVQTSSAQVTEIVAVIDDVAFQTGMLAINASVEAARAGDAGRGFAIVAGEVRQLAQRCAESSEAIRQLIGTASAQVETSSEKLRNAAGALDTIVGGVREVSGRLGGIAEASTRQSVQLQEVSGSIAALDGITRDNAALVEETHAASRTLAERAAALKDAVGSMRLRHGSADEAVALVQQAQAHARQVGRQKALDDFHAEASPWIDRDLFLMGFDRLGNLVAYGADPSRRGSSLHDTPGLAGTDVLERLWDAAEAGGGWVRYDAPHPLDGRLVAKESWFERLDEHTVIGCGFYPAAQAPAHGLPGPAVAWSLRTPRLRPAAAG